MRVTTLMFTLAASAFPMFLTSGPDIPVFAGLEIQTTAESRAIPPASWLPEDPADSLYRVAREALRRSEFTRAATLFRQVREKYPRSGYAPQAYYWEAFSLYRAGSTANLRQARDVLKLQQQRHPDAANEADPKSLTTRICGELARQGDEECARMVADQASEATKQSPNAGRNTVTQRCADDDDDMRIAALNAVLQMDEERAVPLLKGVLAKRGPCSEVLRRKAVFLVSQKQTSETEDILLGAARNDPDKEVREQAVFWLSQVGTDRSVSALDSILRSSQDPQLREKAIFALSQVDNARASQAIRTFAERNDVSSDLREKAIFWIGQQDNPENARYLQNLYARMNNAELKQKIIFSLSQMGGEENARWIMNIALDEKESTEVRKQALFWAGQEGGSITDLVALYGRMTNPEMKEQLIFVYSQSNEKAAADKLVDIARNDSDREMRKKALFWLSQSNDPRAAEILQQIIDQ